MVYAGSFFKDKKTGEWLVWVNNESSDPSNLEKNDKTTVHIERNNELQTVECEIKWVGVSKNGNPGAIGSIIKDTPQEDNSEQQSDNGKTTDKKEKETMIQLIEEIKHRLHILEEDFKDLDGRLVTIESKIDDDDVPF